MEYSIQILGVHISYNKRLQDNMNFQVAKKNITSALKVCQRRNLSLVGKTAVFESLDFSKCVYLAFLTLLPNDTTAELKHIQKKFLWSN